MNGILRRAGLRALRRVAVEAHAHEGNAARIAFGPTVAGAFEAGDFGDAQDLHTRHGDGRGLVALDHDIGRVALAAQDAAAAVVDQATGSFDTSPGPGM